MAANPDNQQQQQQQPVIIVGAGLAGLVAAYELSERKVPTILLDQENASNLGGQAFWSLGGIFCVDSANQRRAGIKDTRELAMRDWLGTAQFDREEDFWPRQWAKAFVDFATDEMEDYIKARGVGFVNVGWAERGDGTADGHGNSVPRFHLTWGTGPEVVRAFREPVEKAVKKGIVQFKFRHAVDELIVDEATGKAIGVRGRILAEDDSARGVKSSREAVDSFEMYGSAIVISSGGIGGNIDAVKKVWPIDRLGPKVPEHFVIGVPAHVDGRMIDIAGDAGANLINRDRMWHYTEGVQNWNPIWPGHGIRVLPGPSPLWLDATGKRLPPFLYPGSDSLGTLKYICSTGFDYTWFILDQSIIAREVGLSGSEQNPDVTGKSIWQFVMSRIFSKKGTVPVQNFQKHGKDFIVRENLEDLVAAMNELARARGGPILDYEKVKETVEIRDSQLVNPYSKDGQAMLLHQARTYWPDKISRIAVPHRILDKAHGPLIAVQMNLLSRKSLGGIETNLQSNVMRADKTPFPRLYAAGEAAGFGGGGVHGYRSLEGTFLGGCIFSGRAAGRAIADELLGPAGASSLGGVSKL